ncbi:PTS sugar transporter subunit IIA [Aurantivibrio plasticivorans]
MDISKILSPSRTCCHIAGGSKKRVLEETAKKIAEDYPALSSDELFRELVNRERLGSTGIGQGIAIPHCRVKNLANAVGVLFTLETAIEFEAIDDSPVDIVFALLVPDEAENQHLQTLSLLAQAFSNPSNLNVIRRANSDESLFKCATEVFNDI